MPMPGDFPSASRWGYLITDDKKAKPLLKNLYKAIVNHIVNKIEPRKIRFLTPEKLAAFYREVGGNLDELFLSTDPLAISEVYTTLGCVHSLLPDPEDDYSPPRIPALHPRGFERWQTIQILMDPDEHVPYILDALRKFDLVDPQTGQGFREYGELTREAFPMAPDEATKDWHETVFLKRIKDNEERAAEAEEKAKGAKPSETTIPGGGASPTAEEEGIRLDDDMEDNETMKGEGPRASYSTRSPSPPRRRPQSRASSSGSYYRGRSRSPLPQKGVDTARLHTQQHSYASGGYSHYGTPELPSDMDDRIRGQSRKNSHIQYVYENGEARPVDEASVRSVSPSVYDGGATPSRRRRISHERNTRGRSAEPMYSPSYYTYGRGYHGHSRGDSVSPMPKFRSKSHGGQSGSSSTEDLQQGYRQWNGPLPPYANVVYQQEVSPSRRGHMRAGHLRTVDCIPAVTAGSGGAADYYHAPPHLVPPSAGSSTIHPLSSAGGGRGTHHKRGISPHDHGHRRAPSGGRGRHSGASSRYQSSTDSLIPPDGLPPVPALSKTTVPTTTNAPPQKLYQSTVMSESEDEYAHYGAPTHTHHHHQYASPNPSHHRSGSGGASTTAQAGAYKRSTRRDREKERDRTIDNDRMMKMHQMGAGGLGLSTAGGYEEEVAVGGRRGGYGRPAASSGGNGGRMTYMAAGVPAGGVKAGGYSPYLG